MIGSLPLLLDLDSKTCVTGVFLPRFLRTFMFDSSSVEAPMSLAAECDLEPGWSLGLKR